MVALRSRTARATLSHHTMTFTLPRSAGEMQGGRVPRATVHARTGASAFTGNRVIRGGSWNNNDVANLRSASRNNNTPMNRNNNLGFRCAGTDLCHLARPERRAPARSPAACVFRSGACLRG